MRDRLTQKMVKFGNLKSFESPSPTTVQRTAFGPYE